MKYLQEVVNSGLSCHMVSRFEKAFAEALGVKHRVATPGCTPARATPAPVFPFEPGYKIIVSPITALAENHGLLVYEDTSQAVLSIYKGRLAKAGILGTGVACSADQDLAGRWRRRRSPCGHCRRWWPTASRADPRRIRPPRRGPTGRRSSPRHAFRQRRRDGEHELKSEVSMNVYRNQLQRLEDAPPILADYPEFVEPLRCDDRYLAPPVVSEPNGDLLVRAWRYWYNARGIVEMENRIEAMGTAIIVVHPWGIDDGHGLRTPEPAGCAFFCTPAKNRLVGRHIEQVLNPFLRRLRDRVRLVCYSMPHVGDDIRKLIYASIDNPPEELNPIQGERQLRALLDAWHFVGEPLVKEIELDPMAPVRSYMQRTPSTDARSLYNGQGFWQLPMPVHSAVQRKPTDLVLYDDEGYPKVRDFLKQCGIRHVLLAGYCTDMCVVSTTCGYRNLSQDFNVFLAGDATLATFPASTTPRFATQTALANAALTQMITQVNWVRIDTGH